MEDIEAGLRMYTEQNCKVNVFYTQSQVSEEEFYNTIQKWKFQILEDDISVMVIDKATQDMAYFHYAVDLHEGEGSKDDKYTPTNFFLRAELTFHELIEHDAVKKLNIQQGQCADVAAAANKKYQLRGLFNRVYDLWFYVAASKGFKYHFGIALNPITIH